MRVSQNEQLPLHIDKPVRSQQLYLPRINRTFAQILFYTGLLVLMLVYVFGAQIQMDKVNTDIYLTDQNAHIYYTQQLYETNYQFVDGARQPLYMILQSFLHTKGVSTETLYYEGRVFSVALSVFMLIALFFIIKRYLPLSLTTLLTLIAAFTFFILKAGYYQPDLLLAFLAFCAFLGMMTMFIKPSWQVAIITGALLGLAQLTKFSFLQATVLFIATYICHCLYHAIVKKQISEYLIRHLFMGLFVGLVFFLVALPNMLILKQKFGSFLYNVNSNFYMWYDSWDDVKAGTRAFGDREGFPTMPAEELPSMTKYISQHSLEAMIKRVINGARKSVLYHCSNSLGHCKYVVSLSLFVLYATIVNRQKIKERIRSHPFIPIFFLLYIAMYFISVSWFMAITYGQRHLLHLILPFLFSMVYIMNLPEIRSHIITIRQKRLPLINIFYLTMSLFLVWDIVTLFQYRLLKVYGGE